MAGLLGGVSGSIGSANSRRLQPGFRSLSPSHAVWKALPPGTDTEKPFAALGRKNKSDPTFVVQKSLWILRVNPRGKKQAHLRKSFRGRVGLS